MVQLLQRDYQTINCTFKSQYITFRVDRKSHKIFLPPHLNNVYVLSREMDAI